ncbi:MAG: hypothetical protein HOV68_20410 [Streptomycetaceae bacterium]|nr:hypothetical protein [Streptomycetaceae bacterium]
MALEDEFAAFTAGAQEDSRVVGLILTGSRAREGAASEHSDHDVTVVAADGEAEQLAVQERRDAAFDVAVMSLRDFRGHALPGSGTEWHRAAFTRAKILKDTSDGVIAALVAEKARLSPFEASRTAADALDAFLNAVYRSAENARDGYALASRLDAAEAVTPYLTCLFALHGRVRPYHKYLAAELRDEPLGDPEWAYDNLAPLLEAAVSDDGLAAVRALLDGLDVPARKAGLGEVFAGWGDDLRIIRGG